MLAPDALSDAVGASRRTSERLFLRFTQMTPSEYCKTQRLERAYDLLLLSNTPIFERGVMTGFRLGANFPIVFRSTMAVAF